eukprot:jgi/Tetstr1/458482/TSEL_004336.t1
MRPTTISAFIQSNPMARTRSAIYAFADILNNCAEPKQYDAAGKKHLLEAAKDKAVLSDVFDECWPRDTQTGIPYPLKKTPMFPIAAPRKQENVRNYLARHYFHDDGKDGQGGRKKGPLPSPDRLAKALFLAVEWHQSEMGRYYQAGKCPPRDVMFKGEEEVCEVTPHSEAAVPTFGGKPIVSIVQRNKIVSFPLAGIAASPKLHGLVGVLAQQQKRAGGIIKHNTNAVKNLAATKAVPGDNVDEGSSPEPPAKKAKHPAKPAAGGLARGHGGAGTRAGGGALG